MTKHFSLVFLGLMTGGLLRAETKEVRWDQLCSVAKGHEIQVKMQTGETVYGYCSQVSGEEITIGRRGKGAVTVARAALEKIEMSGGQGGQLKALHRGVRRGMRFSVRTIFSPGAIIGLAGVPVVAAWGATAAPFCALGDLHAKLSERVELRPI